MSKIPRKIIRVIHNKQQKLLCPHCNLSEWFNSLDLYVFKCSMCKKDYSVYDMVIEEPEISEAV